MTLKKMNIQKELFLLIKVNVFKFWSFLKDNIFTLSLTEFVPRVYKAGVVHGKKFNLPNSADCLIEPFNQKHPKVLKLFLEKNGSLDGFISEFNTKLQLTNDAINKLPLQNHLKVSSNNSCVKIDYSIQTLSSSKPDIIDEQLYQIKKIYTDNLRNVIERTFQNVDKYVFNSEQPCNLITDISYMNVQNAELYLRNISENPTTYELIGDKLFFITKDIVLSPQFIDYMNNIENFTNIRN